MFCCERVLMGGGGGGGEGGGERERERGTVMFALSGQVENINTCLTFLATLGVSVEGVSAKGTDLSSDTWTFSLLSPAPFCRPTLPPTSSPTDLSPLPVLSSYSISLALRSVFVLVSVCLSVSPLTSQIYSKGFSV